MNDHEVRVFSLVQGMRESLDDFEADRLSLGNLSFELKSRIAALEDVADPAWVDELRSFRNQLEIVNAFFIDSGRTTLLDDEQREIDDVVGELRAALIAY